MKMLRRWLLIIVLTIVLVIALVATCSALQWRKIARLQGQFGRAWEISYNINGSPPMLPSSVEHWVERYFREHFSDSYPKNYPELLEDRFEALFLGPIHSIDIWYPDAFPRGDLGSALAAFSSLENLQIVDNASDRPTQQWEQAAQGIAQHKRLRRLALIEAYSLTPKALETLSRSKSLRELSITGATVSRESMLMLSRWTSLDKLVLEECSYDAAVLSQLQRERPGLLRTQLEQGGFCP